MEKKTLTEQLFNLVEQQGKRIDFLIEENKSLRSEIKSLSSKVEALTLHVDGLMKMLEFEKSRADEAEVRVRELEEEVSKK